MKPAAFTCTLLLMAVTAGAQFTLLPQVGFDNSKSKIGVNDLKSFSPLGRTTGLRANLRVDYNFKTGQGFYAALSSSPAVVRYSFSTPNALSANPKAVTGSLRWSVQAGYQFRSKPFNMGTASSKGASRAAVEPAAKRTCGSYHSCGAAKYRAPMRQAMTLRLQPSMGLAYIPSLRESIATDGSRIQYNAGNWNTAMVAGLGFEIGKGRDRLLTTTFYFTKGLGNMGARTVTTTVSGKPESTTLRSSANSWGMTLGVPFALVKNKRPAVKKMEQKSPCRSRCESFHSSCIKRI